MYIEQRIKKNILRICRFLSHKLSNIHNIFSWISSLICNNILWDIVSILVLLVLNIILANKGH